MRQKNRAKKNVAAGANFRLALNPDTGSPDQQSGADRLVMDERRITRLFGLVLGALFTLNLVLNAFAF